jgi:hypothetical protein
MTITNMSNPSTMTGAPVRGSDGDKLGRIDAIYLDYADPVVMPTSMSTCCSAGGPGRDRSA